MTDSSLLRKFEIGKIPAAEFGHKEHVQAAWEMLQTYPFLEAVSRYSTRIESMARAMGAHDKFNVTITVAFMSLIAEKMAACPKTGFDRFYASHPELRRNPLKDWYSDQRLGSDLARRVFLMPEAKAIDSYGSDACS